MPSEISTARCRFEELAEAAHLSPRQFSRVFHAETGQSPAKAVENLRVEAARVLMERSRHPIDAVADQTGFADRNRSAGPFSGHSDSRRRSSGAMHVETQI